MGKTASIPSEKGVAKIERMVTDQYLFVDIGGHVGRHIELFGYVIVQCHSKWS